MYRDIYNFQYMIILSEDAHGKNKKYIVFNYTITAKIGYLTHL